MELNKLIKDIIPLYNIYKINRTKVAGVEALEILWQIGDYIKKYLSGHEIAPHFLYRQIYGKSEQTTNKAQRGYITREFLSRSYRIRNLFSTKKEIKKILPTLNNFNLFREAMPFFDNPKYKLRGTEREELLVMLNSNKSRKEIMTYISNLQREKINIKNPRTQRLQELINERELFINLYNFIYNQIKNNNYKKVIGDLGNINQVFISDLSKNTGALVSDQLRIYVFNIPESVDGLWKEYARMINNMVEKKDAKKRRRFRRLIPPEKIIQLSEMIYAVHSEKDFNKFRM
jgi:hypothetical protein